MYCRGVDVRPLIEAAGTAVDVAGVAIIVVGILFASARAGLSLTRSDGDVYGSYRRSLGRVILLGLELLVAGDIIRTVAIEPTIESVIVLGAIVLVRTFLSFSLEVELSGRWPWQRSAERSAG
jgi:uncharacterized membrane protein